MLKLGHKVRLVLLVALPVLASASPVLAQADAKPSMPLNLRPAAHTKSAAGVQKPRIPVAQQPGDNSRQGASVSVPDDAMPLMAGAMPAPDDAASAGRPAKTGNITAPAKSTRRAVTLSENEVAQFCSNVADPALDARLAWQLNELEQAERRLRERIAEVEAKRAEYEKWMALRDEFLKKAEAGMVEVYSRMRPEAAAIQIAGMADETAAAVLAKLSPRNSSAIFNEMESARAAHLADLLGGMRRVDDGKTSK
jgi:flagellar motility protein MotE (MotC chaperone)